MYNHAHNNYLCPFCSIRDGIEGDYPYTKQQDIFYKDEYILAFIASHWWPTNKGHIIIIPNEHTENIYDISEDLLAKIHIFSKKVSIALKECYHCDGITLRQNNEESGDQDVWHYHLHIFPRYIGDSIDQSNNLKYLSDPQDRIYYAQLLKTYFN